MCKKENLNRESKKKKVTFRVFNAIKHPHDNDRVDVIEAIMSNQLGHSKPLETSLTREDPSSCDDDIVRE